MSNDIYHILQRFDSVAEGLSPAQEKVKQLPALFRPKDTSPQLSGPYPGRNATLGYLVGEGEEGNDLQKAVTRRIVNQHPEWITKYGVEALMQAIDDVTEGEDDLEEIGSSDISAYVRYVKDHLDDRMGSREEMDDRRPFAESAATTEDVISTVKKKLGDYLSDLSKEIKKDPDLKDKLEKDIDQIGPAVKTLKTDDGHEIKIHGNEDDGFRITIKNREAKTQFKNLDEAVMAVEMYCARRRDTPAVNNTDYIEEA